MPKNNEIFELQLDAGNYDIRIDALSANSVVSPTLAKLLPEISKNGLPDTSLPHTLIGNTVTKFVHKKYTSY